MNIPKRRPAHGEIWRFHELAYLRQHWRYADNATAIAEYLGRTPKAIQRRANRLRLKTLIRPRGHRFEPPTASWIDAARSAAADVGLPWQRVVGGDRARPVCVARWKAWRAVIQANPHCSIIGVARVTGHDHATILHGLKRLKEIEGTHA